MTNYALDIGSGKVKPFSESLLMNQHSPSALDSFMTLVPELELTHDQVRSAIDGLSSLHLGILELDRTKADKILKTTRFAGQRPITKKTVETIAAKMDNGKFRPEDTLKFGYILETGQVAEYDGQHRTLALTIAHGDHVIPFPIVFTVFATTQDARDAFTETDQHGKRTVNDTVEATGVAENSDITNSDAKQIAAAVRSIVRSGLDPALVHANVEDNSVLMALVRHYVPAFKMLNAAILKTPYRSNLQLASVLAVALTSVYYFGEKAVGYWASIAHAKHMHGDSSYGTPLDNGRVERKFITWLDKNINNRRHSGGVDKEVIATSILHLNAFLDGKVMSPKKVKYTIGGAWPTIVGIPQQKALHRFAPDRKSYDNAYRIKMIELGRMSGKRVVRKRKTKTLDLELPPA